MDDRLVQLALDQGLITADQVDAARTQQRTLADRGVEQSLWYLLQDLGHLSESDANRLRKHTSSTNLKALEVEGYVIQGRLGSGGMGDVFRGRNAAGEQVAVKLLGARFLGNVEYQTRFDREAKATMRLKHPHIVRTLSHGTVSGNRYLIMEVVEGQSLKSRLQDHGPITELESLHLCKQMAAALQYAWDHSVLHRDVKPANIILGPPRPGVDEPFCAKLCDFGLAKVWQEGSHDEETTHGGLTGAGLALGTPHYMSPEQASGQQDLDQRCDIYGLGASLYHALLGKTMYSGKSSAVIMYKQVTEQIDLGELRKRGVREGMVKLLEEMLVKDRIRRIQAWRQVDERIEGLLAFSRGQRPSRPLAPAQSSAPVGAAPQAAAPTPWGLLIGAVAAVLILALAGWVWLRLTPPPAPGPLDATPATLAQALVQAVATGREVRLAPGTYPPQRLGAAQRGLRLTGGPGVEFRASSGPALVLEPGFSGELDGIGLSGAPALEALAGAEAVLAGCRLVIIAGSATDAGPAATIAGATLTAADLAADAPVEVRQSGSLHLNRPRLTGGLLIEDASAEITGGDIQAQGVPAVEVRTGGLTIDGCALSSTGSALRGDRIDPLHLRDVRLAGGAVGLELEACQVPLLERVQISASGTGIQWGGRFDPAWRWSGLRIEAPEPSQGLPADALTR